MLQQLLHKVCLIYLDDIIIFSEDMLVCLGQVFLRFRLRFFNLKLNPKKCSFLKKEIKYLGHIVSKKG